MTLQEFLKANGSHATARKLIDKKIRSLIYMGIEDLPDTSELAEKVEELAELLEDYEGQPVKKILIQEYLREIDTEFIENLIYG